MSATTCPDREELFDYAVGRLSDEASHSVAEHLESCQTCQAGLATFDDADDTLVARLRQPDDEDPYLQESQCQVAVARARKVAGRPVAEGGESADPASTHSLLLGSLGEYQLLEKLGRGGMGTVYRAMHTKLERVVALKVLPKSRSDDEKAIARFEREMKAIGRLDHRNIVHAHDAREIEGKPVLIMEYVEGLDLAKLVRRCGPLPVADACELARQAALGLQYAHENGLVHRDVKPSNLMLTPEGEVKVLDLGLARFHREHAAGEEMTGSGQAMGTADYMAPEQASDSHAVDIRADVYSLGCTLYKLLCGRAPFGGPDYRGTFEKMTAHVQEPVPPIGESGADVPDELAAVLDRMLAKEPDERFATPGEVAEALRPFCIECDLAGLLVRAEQAEAADAGAPPCPALPRDGSSAAPASQPTPLPFWRRGKLLAAALGLMLLSVGAGIALGIIITIYRDGKATRIAVEDGSSVNIDRDGNVGVTPPGKNGKPVPPVPKSDAEAILGTWEVITSSFEGYTNSPHSAPGLVAWTKPAPARSAEVWKSSSVVFTEDTVKLCGRYFRNRKLEYAIPPNRTPKAIDLLATNKGARGIYELEGDQLKMCLNWGEREEFEQLKRPDEFWVGLRPKNELIVLKRVRDADAMIEANQKAMQGTWEVVKAWAKMRGSRDRPGRMYAAPYGEIAEGREVVIRGSSLTIKGVPGEEARSDAAKPDPAGAIAGRPLMIQPMADDDGFDFELHLHGRIDFDTLHDARCSGVYLLEDDRLIIRLTETLPTQIDAPPADGEVFLELKLVEAAPTGDGQRPADTEAIQGTWKGSVHTSWRGSEGERRPDPVPVTLLVTESGFSYYGLSTKNQLGNVFEYAIDPTKKPKQIDFSREGKILVPGIYEVSGDRLKVMMQAETGNLRPKSFFLPAYSECHLLDVRRDDGPGSAGASMPGGALTVHVDSDGRASVFGKIFDGPSLQEMLREFVRVIPQITVRLSAELDTEHRHVATILEMIKSTGVADVSIVVGEIAPARLDFRIVPTRDGTGGPAIDAAEIRRYIDELKGHGSERSEQRLKIALQKELGVIIGQMNGVETASVLYDTQITGGLRREKTTLASVAVKPSGDEPLDDSQVRTIRRLVAGAVAGLMPENVTVADLSGSIYHDDTDGTDAPEGPFAAGKRAYEREWKAKILNALAYVPGVIVAVNVALDLETVPQSEKPDADSPQETGLTPARVSVWVSIPGSYIEKVWQERNPPATGKERNTPSQAALDAIRKEQTTKIRQQIAGLLPAVAGVDDPTELVTVTLSGGKRREAYAWFELSDEIAPPPGSITATYRGQVYALLANTPEDVMLAEEDGKRAWGLEAVHLEKDPQGHPAIGMDFDEEAQGRLAALTGAHIDHRLAMLLNDRVVCAPTIKTKLSRRALISGRFDDEEIQQMFRALQAGMVTHRDAERDDRQMADETPKQPKTPDTPEETATKSDSEAMQGAWEAVSAVNNGQEAPEQILKRMKFVFSGDRLTTNEEVAFKLDPTKQPKTIEITNWNEARTKSTTDLGIYELDGDRLKICINKKGQRPAQFSSQKGSENSLFVLKRAPTRVDR